MRDDLEKLDVQCRPASPSAHFTEIALYRLYRIPQTKTVSKIKDHLASIYRVFIREGLLELRFDGDVLEYGDPKVLVWPYHRAPTGKPVEWRKDFEFDFGLGLRAHGFAALRETASTSTAGFALFRRNRLIEGSADETYRPEKIFGKPNSYRFQRLFGEIHLEGFEVSHTKDGFKWQDNEDIFLDILREYLTTRELPLLDQAEGYRAKIAQKELKAEAEKASQRTAETMQRELQPVIEQQTNTPPATEPLPPDLHAQVTSAVRQIDVEHCGLTWKITLELSLDPSVGDWLSISEKKNADPPGDREIGVRVALAHPFMERYCRPDSSEIEALVRVAAALAIADVTARDRGVSQYGTIRRNVNQLLRDCFSKP